MITLHLRQCKIIFIYIIVKKNEKTLHCPLEHANVVCMTLTRRTETVNNFNAKFSRGPIVGMDTSTFELLMVLYLYIYRYREKMVGLYLYIYRKPEEGMSRSNIWKNISLRI